MDNRSLSHTRWKCQYHIVFIPKYRKRYCMEKLRQRCQRDNSNYYASIEMWRSLQVQYAWIMYI